MALITSTVPNLSGGVSQQPASQRLPNQCEAQDNAIPLLVGGLVKRPPTNHVFEMKTAGGGSLDLSGAFTHFITRDPQEEFIVTLTGESNTVHVHGMDGVARTVYTDSGVAAGTYLNSSTPQTSFRAVTIADVTFLLNTGVTVAQDSTLSTYSRNQTSQQHEGMVWIKNTGQGAKFTVTVTDDTTTHTATVNHGPDPDSVGATATAPALRVARTTAGSGTPSASTIEITNTQVILKEDGSAVLTINLWDAAADTLLEVAEDINAVAEWTAILEGSGTTASGSLQVLAETTAYGATVDLQTESDPLAFAYPPNHPATSDIASSLATGTSIVDCTVTSGGVNGYTGYTAESSGSVLFIQNTTDFQLSVSDGFGQQAHQVIKDEVGDFSHLPPIAKNNMLVKVVGDPESEVDDYYVKFATNGDAVFGEGIWVESLGPGEKYLWDYDTLPLVLVRQTTTDGNGNLTFSVKRADGVSPSTGADSSITWANFKFTPKEVGSTLTNPAPSFVGGTINDISFFKGRLAVISGENCCLSETGELFNFYRTTTTLLPDTAVVDLGVGGTEINRLDKAVPFSDRLVLFSEKTQFALSGTPIISPTTAAIAQVTNYDVTTSVSPAPVGSTLMFAFNRGSYSGIREYFKTNETDINFNGVETTSHVPKYIPGIVQKITASTEENIVAVLSRTEASGGGFDATSQLFMYKFFNTDRGRAQAAWFTFTFNGATIIDLKFIQQSLYLILLRDEETFLERVDLQTGLVDTGSEYVTSVDRRCLITGADINAVTNTLTLPYDLVSGDTMQVVSSDGEIMTILSSGTNTITLSEDITAAETFYVGIPYTMSYEMTKPVMKRPKADGGYEAVVAGRHQVRYMTFVFDGTAHFVVRVTPVIGGDLGTAVDYPFTGRYLSAGGSLGSVPSEDGEFRVPVFSQSNSVKVEILNDSPLPSNLQSVEVEANYVSRAQRTQ